MIDDSQDGEYIEEVVYVTRPISKEATENLPKLRNLAAVIGIAGIALSTLSANEGIKTLQNHKGKQMLDSNLSSSFNYLSSTVENDVETALSQYETGDAVKGKQMLETIEQTLQEARVQIQEQEISALEQGVNLTSIRISTVIAENVVKNTAEGYIESDVRRPHLLSTIQSLQQSAQYARAPMSNSQYHLDIGFSMLFIAVGACIVFLGCNDAIKAQREINRRKQISKS